MLALLSLLALETPALAFCGFYVSGADASLYNDATMVVMMREGKRTVLSMQNNYEGPPSDFAMVVPVPTVVHKQDVKTLSKDLFKKIDTLSAPRLVEYWEKDPCEPDDITADSLIGFGASGSGRGGGGSSAARLGVKVEAQFSVAEYDIVVLSAKDSAGLDTWLRQEHYNIPPGAEATLRPYVAAGTKFFVAKVDADRVSYSDGRAVLSPLRVSYESEDFALPMRLGLLNAEGDQDIIVHILANNQRYEAANYPNRTIPTNIQVLDGVRDDFGDFYDALFVQTAKVSGAVVTEYAWASGTCDPCPGPTLSSADLMSLGGDITGVQDAGAVVLTRLHYRYNAESLTEDLVFQAAEPIRGGRGMPDARGDFSERESTAASTNNFQGRYVILHPWEGAVSCEKPRRGRWGGPPGGSAKTSSATSRLSGAAKPTEVLLAGMVAVDVPSIGLKRLTGEAVPVEAPAPVEPPAPAKESPAAERGFCGSTPVQPGLWSALLAALLLRRR